MSSVSKNEWKKKLKDILLSILLVRNHEGLCKCMEDTYVTLFKVVSNCVEKKKTKRAKILRVHLQRLFILCNSARRKFANVEQKANQQLLYEDLLGALMSFFINVTLISRDISQEQKCSFISMHLFLILGSSPNHIVNAVLGADMFFTESSVYLMPLYRKILAKSCTKMTSLLFLKCIVLSKLFLKCLPLQKKCIEAIVKKLPMESVSMVIIKKKLKQVCTFTNSKKMAIIKPLQLLKLLKFKEGRLLLRKLNSDLNHSLAQLLMRHKVLARQKAETFPNLSTKAGSLFFFDNKADRAMKTPDVDEKVEDSCAETDDDAEVSEPLLKDLIASIDLTLPSSHQYEQSAGHSKNEKTKEMNITAAGVIKIETMRKRKLDQLLTCEREDPNPVKRLKAVLKESRAFASNLSEVFDSVPGTSVSADEINEKSRSLTSSKDTNLKEGNVDENLDDSNEEMDDHEEASAPLLNDLNASIDLPHPPNQQHKCPSSDHYKNKRVKEVNITSAGVIKIKTMKISKSKYLSPCKKEEPNTIKSLKFRATEPRAFAAHLSNDIVLKTAESPSALAEKSNKQLQNIPSNEQNKTTAKLNKIMPVDFTSLNRMQQEVILKSGYSLNIEQEATSAINLEVHTARSEFDSNGLAGKVNSETRYQNEKDSLASTLDEGSNDVDDPDVPMSKFQVACDHNEVCTSGDKVDGEATNLADCSNEALQTDKLKHGKLETEETDTFKFTSSPLSSSSEEDVVRKPRASTSCRRLESSTDESSFESEQSSDESEVEMKETFKSGRNVKKQKTVETKSYRRRGGCAFIEEEADEDNRLEEEIEPSEDDNNPCEMESSNSRPSSECSTDEFCLDNGPRSPVLENIAEEKPEFTNHCDTVITFANNSLDAQQITKLIECPTPPDGLEKYERPRSPVLENIAEEEKPEFTNHCDTVIAFANNSLDAQQITKLIECSTPPDGLEKYEIKENTNGDQVQDTVMDLVKINSKDEDNDHDEPKDEFRNNNSSSEDVIQSYLSPRKTNAEISMKYSSNTKLLTSPPNTRLKLENMNLDPVVCLTDISHLERSPVNKEKVESQQRINESSIIGSDILKTESPPKTPAECFVKDSLCEENFLPDDDIESLESTNCGLDTLRRSKRKIKVTTKRKTDRTQVSPDVQPPVTVEAKPDKTPARSPRLLLKARWHSERTKRLKGYLLRPRTPK